MSWSLTYTSYEDFVNDHPTNPPWQNEAVQTEVDEQVREARETVERLVESGVIGTSAKDFHVTISGHANKDHEPASGWANDCISISVSQKSPPPTGD